MPIVIAKRFGRWWNGWLTCQRRSTNCRVRGEDSRDLLARQPLRPRRSRQPRLRLEQQKRRHPLHAESTQLVLPFEEVTEDFFVMASKLVVIYRFVCKRTAKSYIGKHECDPTGWPSAGIGRLPDGYGGSGKWLRAARKKHGDDAFTWAVLEVVPLGADWQEAERQQVAAERACSERRCMNIVEGGEGTTSADHANPTFRARRAAGMRRVWADPAYRAKLVAAGSRPATVQRLRQQASAGGRAGGRVSGPRNVRKIPRQSLVGGSRHGASRRKLQGAMTRRDHGLAPLPWDNQLLSNAGEKPNMLPVAPPRQPQPGGKVAQVLAVLIARPTSPTEVASKTGMSELEVRYKIDQLVNLGWPIVNADGAYRVAT